VTDESAIRSTGPASRALANELLGEIRRQGIVVWLDKDASYTRFADSLTPPEARGAFPAPVVGFRGSFLDLLFALETHGNDLDRQPLLVHMPGFNEETIRRTPVLELYEAGVRFRKGLDTLIREAAAGRAAPADVEAFLATGPSLEKADEWLEAAVERNASGLAAVLDATGPWMLAQALAAPDGGDLARRASAPSELAALADYIHKLTGMDADWIALARGPLADGGAATVLHALAAWVLSVEYVHDLKRPARVPELQRLRALSAPLVDACRDIAQRLRKDAGDAYERLADEVAGVFSKELSELVPDDLGQIDTFREEETSVLAGAVEALRKGDWARARAWCEARQGERSFWLQRDQLRRWAWSLVEEAACFAETLARHARPLDGARSLEEAAQRYAGGAFEVDRAHRRFEQKRLARLESRLPHYGALHEAATELRRKHREWADGLARDFAGLCTENGFLPPPALQQRTLFEQVVRPLTLAGEKVAVFMIDAFRYEMATELVSELAGTGTVVDLKPRFAELPTITSVGMNALAPVSADGRLDVAGVFRGFRTGEYTVNAPAGRARSMGMRAAGKPAHLVTLAHVCDSTTPALVKELKPHALVIVHSKEIDDAGEANVGLPTFESTLQQIRAAWHHLQLAGVKAFVLTADHGFLLQDETTLVRPYGTKRDPLRRHVLDEQPRAESSMVNVSLSSLGYDGLPGYLLLREDTAVFATGTAGATFVHGGNSLQERLIPVLTVTRKRAERGGTSQYEVELEPLPDVVGLHRLRVRVLFAKNTTTSLGFATAQTVDLALRSPGRADVRVVLKDCVPQVALRNGGVRAAVGEAWTEVFFGLDGSADERVRVEVFHAEGVENVRPATAPAWYGVSGGAPGAAVSPVEQTLASWTDAIADEGVRRVFLHIEKHKAITETEVTAILGSPRVFRRFSLDFEAHTAKLPFGVRIETGEGGKRYVLDVDRKREEQR
jgi:hypothetical protein